MFRFCCFVILTSLAECFGPAHADEVPRKIDFNRDIRPILTENCFLCHGPDPGTREADLRLDQESGAKESAIVPGKAADSELIRRIVSADPDEMMPPRETGKQLSAEQIRLLKQWIDGGADWAKHWSFNPPIKPELPVVSDPTWPGNAIDHFVMAQLDGEGTGSSPLRPSARASATTLARRVALDLTGLPPTPEQMQTFLNEKSEDAYEKLVDELLHSKHYGERMAMVWLDAARYADSDGYQADATRQNWPWRDWVIDAYNRNMPFDDFTIQQFAGDLMPDASPEQILATCFHRNHMHNGEGGRDPEESRVEYVLDRVNTIGTVWLGLTLGCAQCHSHKYDPISQSEYYQLNAYFNSIDENGKAGSGAGPFLKYKSPYVQAGLEDSSAWLTKMESQLQTVRAEESKAFDPWLREQQTRIAATGRQHQSWKSYTAGSLVTTGGTRLNQVGDIYEVAGQDPRHDDYLISLTPQQSRVTGMRLTVLPSADSGGKLSRYKDGHIILTNVKVRLRSANGTSEQDLSISKAVATYQSAKSGRVYGPVQTVLDDDPRTGWMTTGSSSSEKKTAAFLFENPIQLRKGESLVVELRQRSLRGYSNLQEFKLEFTDEVGPAALALDSTPLERLAKLATKKTVAKMELDSELRKDLEAQFLADRTSVKMAQVAVEKAKRRKQQYDAAAKGQNVTVLKERTKQRDTHILVRGVWNNKGDKVVRATPQAISVDESQRINRTEFARWLVSRSNPLTARVTVNRYWQMYFGHGLVRTPGDFGTQGAPPTHPDLLDWLAVEFMESGWDIRHIQRLIVTSATYQQSSKASTELLQRDPQNRLLARAARFRLPSWMIRDSALAVSGLLERRIGGPPVFPFQPEGAWLDATMGRFKYETSVGSDRYRRGVYTFWRRSVGPTGMFDASKRRVCEVRSVRTNTPLQALTLMNDETFVEAANALAATAIGQHSDIGARTNSIFNRILLRSPTQPEMNVLSRQFQHHVSEFAGDETAALAMVASTLLNLDETITHE